MLRSPFSAIFAIFGDFRHFRRFSPFSAIFAIFGDFRQLSAKIVAF
jgi:hypothetical protein